MLLKEEKDVLKIARGYSKDRQPDLSQIKLGMETTAEGLSIYDQVLDGNQNDNTWDLDVMWAIESWWFLEQFAEAIYVVGSAFVTKENLQDTKRKDQPDLVFSPVCRRLLDK